MKINVSYKKMQGQPKYESLNMLTLTCNMILDKVGLQVADWEIDSQEYKNKVTLFTGEALRPVHKNHFLNVSSIFVNQETGLTPKFWIKILLALWLCVRNIFS